MSMFGLPALICSFFSLLFLAFSWLTPLRASERVVVADFSQGVDEKGVPSGWRLKERIGKADLSIVQEGPLHALRLRSADTSFALEKGVGVNPRLYPLLHWKWKVTKLPGGGDFRKPGADDQAAQIFLAFSNRHAIVYLWDTTAPEGASGNAWAPPFMTIKALVLRSGHREVGKWIAERRNIMQDYKSLFGHHPPVLAGIRIQINSQHTDTSGESYFADMMLETN
ncbi:MAG: DUF3047 domain-containing protein [Thermodesulfobacteriota bacterium]